MDGISSVSSALQTNLDSLQQAISISTLKKAMNADAASTAAMVEALQQVPVSAPPSNHIIDVLA